MEVSAGLVPILIQHGMDPGEEVGAMEVAMAEVVEKVLLEE